MTKDVRAMAMSGVIMQPFPWKEAIGFGLGVLRLSPEQFWRMTPRELAYAIEAVTGRGAPLDRQTFEKLMKSYPDDDR
jgi:uncharacterized phage protein (TIGR02216 family)